MVASICSGLTACLSIKQNNGSFNSLSTCSQQHLSIHTEALYLEIVTDVSLPYLDILLISTIPKQILCYQPRGQRSLGHPMKRQEENTGQ
jgi:hypothetical protein